MNKTITKPKNKEEIKEIKNVPYQLLDGWKWVRLGEIAEINPQKSEILKNINIKSNAPFKVSFIPMNYVDDIKGEIIKHDEKNINEVYKGYTYFKNRDIIFAKITPCMENGKCAIAEGLINGIGFGSTEFHVIRVKEKIFNKLIWFYLRLEKIRNEATKLFTGAVGHKRVPKEFLENLLIPLPFKNGKPDLEKQKQIVGRVETIFKEINKAITLQQKALENTKKLFESVLYKIFKEAEEDKENWKWMKLEEIAEQKKFSIVDGPFGTQLQKKHYKKQGIPLVRILNIKYGLIFDEKNLVYISENDFARLQRSAVYPNDILLAKTGATIGKVCLFPSKYKRGLITSSCAKISVNKHLFSHKFIAYLIRSKPIQKNILGISTGATRNSLTLSLIKNLILPIPIKDGKPDLEKQKQIAEYLDNLHNKIKQLEELQQIQIEKFKQLKESILNKAFKGELV